MFIKNVSANLINNLMEKNSIILVAPNLYSILTIPTDRILAITRDLVSIDNRDYIFPIGYKTTNLEILVGRLNRIEPDGNNIYILSDIDMHYYLCISQVADINDDSEYYIMKDFARLTQAALNESNKPYIHTANALSGNIKEYIDINEGYEEMIKDGTDPANILVKTDRLIEKNYENTLKEIKERSDNRVKKLLTQS